MQHEIVKNARMNLVRILESLPEIKASDIQKNCAQAANEALDWRDECYTEAHKRSFTYKAKRSADFVYLMSLLRDKCAAYAVFPEYVRESYRKSLRAHDDIIRLDKILSDAREAGWKVDKATSIYGTEASMVDAEGNFIQLKYDCAVSTGPGLIAGTGYVARLYLQRDKVEGIVTDARYEIKTFADAMQIICDRP